MELETIVQIVNNIDLKYLALGIATGVGIGSIAFGALVARQYYKRDRYLQGFENLGELSYTHCQTMRSNNTVTPAYHEPSIKRIKIKYDDDRIDDTDKQE